MKRFGFTLAEVLITLGIIGVVSALVIPTFTASTQMARIGPKLGKAVSTFEQGVQAVLDDAQSDSISGAQVQCPNTEGLTDLSSCFYQQLENHIKGSADGNRFNSSDGVVYSGTIPSDITEGEFAHNTTVLRASETENGLMININPNAADVPGGNLFYFHLMDDGTLIPLGGARESGDNVWTARCRRDATVTGADRRYCTGHVMGNGLKAEYRLGR